MVRMVRTHQDSFINLVN